MAPEEEKLTRRNPLDFPIVSSRVGSGRVRFRIFHISIRRGNKFDWEQSGFGLK